MALWLDTAFAGFDKAILSLLHSVAEGVGGLLTPLMKLITLLGEKGLIFFLMALIFMCFARTRKMGICLFGAVCCGALITNIILKDTVARLRPFESAEIYRQWWQAVGSPKEDGFSFPSGHMTACASGLTALCLMKGRRLIVPSVIIGFLMGLSRNYLMAHYPTDVIFATLVGMASGYIAWFITLFIYKILEEHDDIGLFAFILDFNLPVERLPLPNISLPGQYKGKHEK